MKQGDTVIFSSRMIPGNETAIHALYMALESRGVDVITSGTRRMCTSPAIPHAMS